MTIGIYALRFNGTEKVYIGKSKSIESRFTKHKYRLKNGYANYKLMEAYALYGPPILEILLECTEDKLEYLENETIIKFDAVNNGLNINTKSSGGIGLMGDKHGNSKYKNNTIELVFDLLIDNTNYIKEISNKTNVSIDVIRDISKCKSHRWLKDKYPEKYLILESLIGTRNKGISAKQRSIVYPSITSPTGEVFNIENISEFARQHGLNKSHLCGVLNGKRKTHLGWAIK
jgi:hypothetical protein